MRLEARGRPTACGLMLPISDKPRIGAALIPRLRGGGLFETRAHRSEHAAAVVTRALRMRADGRAPALLGLTLRSIAARQAHRLPRAQLRCDASRSARPPRPRPPSSFETAPRRQTCLRRASSG